VELVAALIGAAVAVCVAALGAVLARRNQRQSQADRLLVEALNDAVASIAEASFQVGGALPAYASAAARIALHAPPDVLVAWRRFNDEATTATETGRDLLVAAIQAARRHTDQLDVLDDDIRALLFRAVGPVGFEFDRLLAAIRGELEVSLASVEQVTTERGSAATREFDNVLDAGNNVAAILDAFGQIESAVGERVQAAGTDARGMGSMQLVREALRLRVITPETAHAIEGMAVLRNLVAHGREGTTDPQRVREYLALADAVLFSLRDQPREG
jgi:hypothetical protein